jgi:hypothetical protein
MMMRNATLSIPLQITILNHQGSLTIQATIILYQKRNEKRERERKAGQTKSEEAWRGNDRARLTRTHKQSTVHLLSSPPSSHLHHHLHLSHPKTQLEKTSSIQPEKLKIL